MERNAEAGSMSELVRDFLDPAEFYKALNDIDINHFYGVPDSLLKGKTYIYPDIIRGNKAPGLYMAV